MNTERKKAILTLTGTLLIGILLGILVPGIVRKVRKEGDHARGNRGGRKMEVENKKEWFTGAIYKIVQPDSNQIRKIKPIAEWASTQIDSIEASSNAGLATVLDSVKKQLKPIITEKQFKRLEEFDSKAKGHWRDRGRHK
jgi:hypothetical protein